MVGKMKCFLQEKWKTKDAETGIFLLFFAGMAIYYGWRMFALTPWYDELYTYYYFISRGPVYAAIHWPLPNNHVGYSTLSACLLVFGSSVIALRGVSWLCSLISLGLLFRIGRKVFAKGFALIPVFLFAGLNLVNTLAVQGRGYALVTCCYLTAIWELVCIVAEHDDKAAHYVIFGISLVLALWAIPSSVYVVVPICLIGGWSALLQKQYRQLRDLIITSVISALCTFFLYAIIWLAIGSNLLSKTADSGYFGQGHVSIILHAPLAALWRGVQYMLATPYIQSVSRDGFFGQFTEWLGTLFGTYFSFCSGWHMEFFYAVIFGLGVILLIKRIADGIRSKEVVLFTEWYLLLTILLLPLLLVIQCTLPYYRVFSFAGVMVALLITWLLQYLTDAVSIFRKKFKITHVRITCVRITLVIASAALMLLSFGTDTGSYSTRDDLIRDAYEQLTVNEFSRIAVTDCDQEYLLLYLYGIGEDRVSRDITEADAVLVDKYLLGRDYDFREAPEEWKFYLTAQELDTGYLEREMEAVYENGQFVLYTK
jgi:hypothetical protein